MLRTWPAAQVPAQARAASKTMRFRQPRFLVRVMATSILARLSGQKSERADEDCVSMRRARPSASAAVFHVSAWDSCKLLRQLDDEIVGQQ